MKPLFVIFAFVAFFCTAANAADVLSIKEVDTPPAPVTRSAPVVPNELKDVTGTIHVKMVITETGSVSDAKVVKSTAESLNSTAVDCVNAWVFKPAQKNGSNVAVAVVIPIRFK